MSPIGVTRGAPDGATIDVMVDVSNARPTAEGTLAARPLTHLLVYTRTRRMTGRLVLRAPDGTGGAIALWNGHIAAARTAPPIAYFGSVAAELGFVDGLTADATLRDAMGQKRLHGEVLVERGKITTAQRDQVLAEQTSRKVHKLFALPPASVFAFYEDPPSMAEPPLALDAILPVWRAIRDGSSDASVRDVVAPFVAAQLRVVDEAPFARAGFSPQEKIIAQSLKARPMSIAQLRAQFPAFPHEKLDRIVYLLLIIKAAEASMNMSPAGPSLGGLSGGGSLRAMQPDAIVAALKGSMRPAAPPTTLPPTSAAPRNSAAPAYPSGPLGGKPTSSIPPRRVSGSVASVTIPAQSRAPSVRTSPGSAQSSQSAMSSSAASAPTSKPLESKPVQSPSELGVAGIKARAQTVENEDPSFTLGLTGEGTIDGARAAYFRLVKLWHPDRMTPDLAPVRAEVGKIFVQMTKAHHTLTDPEARRAHLAVKNAKPIVPERPLRRDVIRIIDAAIAKKDFTLAAEESRKLLAGDARDCEAQALVAWIATSAGEGPEGAVRAALPALDRAVNGDTDCIRAHFYRGMVNKRLGNTNSAYRDFVHAVQLDPKHVDASREVRLHEMRMKKR